MKNLLLVLGSVFAALITLLVIAAIIFIPRALRLNKEATVYVAENVLIIVNHWHAQNLIDRATPQLLSAAKSTNEIERLFARFQQLGSLKHLNPP